jgi:flagellar protein FliO/FliZ
VVELVLRITFSLLVVLMLMWGLAKLARRPLSGGRGGHGALAVLTRQQLGRGSSVAVVRVADKALVLGITDNQVNLLGEADLAAVQEHLAAPVPERRDAVALPGDAVAPASPLEGSALSPRTWSTAVNFLRERTVRR